MTSSTTPAPNPSAIFHEAVGDARGIILDRLRKFAGRISGWANSKYRKAINTLLMFYGFFFLVIILIVWTAMLYWLIYWIIMPQMRFESPLFFDFDPFDRGHIVEQQQQPNLPIASVFFNRKDRQWTWYPSSTVITPQSEEDITESRQTRERRKVLAKLTEFPGGPPDDEALKRPPLDTGEEYNVWVSLVIPETDSNLHLGTFMLTAELLDATRDGPLPRVLARSKRPVTMEYATPSTRWFRDTTLLLWRALGFARPQQTVDVLMFEKWHEDGDVDRVPSSIRLTLSNTKVSLSSAKVFFLVELYGIRWFMYHWAGTSFFLFVSFGLALQATMAICFALIRITSKVVHDDGAAPAEDEQDENIVNEQGEVPPARISATPEEQVVDPLAE